MTQWPLLTPDDLASHGDEDGLLVAATERVRNYCGWHIAPVLTTTVEIDGASPLILPTLRLVEVVSIEDTDAPGTFVDLSTVRVGTSGVLAMRRDAAFDARWWGRYDKRLRVTMRHGHDSAPDAEDVVMGMVERASARAKSGLLAGAVQHQAGPFGVTLGSPSGIYLTDDDKATLDHYRFPGRP